MSEPRQVRIGKLRSQMMSLLALTGELSAGQRELLSDTLAELDATIDALRTTDDELRRLLAELTAAHEIVESERERYLDLFQFAPNGYLVTDSEGRIREANRAATDLLNAPPDALRRVALTSFVAPRDRKAFAARLARLGEGDRLGEWEVQLHPRQRDPIQAALSVATIRRRSGHAIGLRWILRDVTEQKRLQDSMRLLSEASSQLAAFLDVDQTLPALARLTVPRVADWCVIHLIEPEKEGELRLAAVAARPAVAALFRQHAVHLDRRSLDPGRLPGKALRSGAIELARGKLDELFAELLPGLERPAYPRGLAAGSAVAAPLVARGQALGLLIFGRSRGRPAFGPTDLQLVEELTRRISLALDNARLYHEAQLARQEAERREQQLAEFIRMVAHDVQQPLSAAHWHLQVMHRALERGNLQGAQLSEEAIEVATERLDAMVRDLVESARLEVGHMRLDCEPIDLSGFVREMVNQLGPGASRVRLEAETVPAVMADPARLVRVVGNLLTNALKYSETEVLVRVRKENGEVVMSVTDHGIGIAPEDLPHLFDRGYRSAGAANKADGLGLGLYITRLLVQAHGGRIWATSEPRQGSTFSFALPVDV